MDRIVSIETRNIGLELEFKKVKEIEANKQKAVHNYEIVDEWLNGKGNAK